MWHNVVCVVSIISYSILLCAFVYIMFIIVWIFKVRLCFLCAFCNAQSQSMNFNTQNCYITSWCALCTVHVWCVYICWKFKLCASIGNPNLFSLFVHCAHQLGIQICSHCLSIVRIKWDLVCNVHVKLLKSIGRRD